MSDYVAGGTGPELGQQNASGRRLLSSLLGTLVPNGPGRSTTADLPPVQRFPTRPLILDGSAVVPGATGAELLPGRPRIAIGDGEPGANNANDFEL